MLTPNGGPKVFSFNRDKKRIELQSYMRRVADLTSPNLAPLSGDSRLEGRYNRSLPVLIVPRVGGNHRAEEAAFAVSKDICDRGLSLLACQPYPLTEVIVEQGEDNPLFAKIREYGVRRERPLVTATVKAFAEGRVSITHSRSSSKPLARVQKSGLVASPTTT